RGIADRVQRGVGTGDPAASRDGAGEVVTTERAERREIGADDLVLQVRGHRLAGEAEAAADAAVERRAGELQVGDGQRRVAQHRGGAAGVEVHVAQLRPAEIHRAGDVVVADAR